MAFSLVSSRGQKKSGFTLVEVLVVLAIIAVLAGILFPVFSSAREGARRTVCASNLRQIGLGMQMYAQDHNGKLPRASAPIPKCGWPGLFSRYIRNSEVFLCPSDEVEHPYDPACSEEQAQAGSYTIVALEDALTRRDPTKTILTLDGKGEQNSVGTRTAGKLTVVPEDIMRTFGEARHKEGYNAVFGDGHVKYLIPDKMLDPLLWGHRQ